MTVGALFLSGLAAGVVAGTASCTAVQGGFLTGRTSVGMFLVGRLISHVIVGAALGLVGSAIQLGPQARTILLITAGLILVFFGIRQLKRAPPCHTPKRGGLLLGLATVLVPCGVTLSMEVVAVSTGSAIGGAAVMAGFVAGSTPGFVVLGLLIRRLATKLVAIIAIAAGIFTTFSGLRLGGWLPDFGTPAVAATPGPRGTQTLTVWATPNGFRPGIATAKPHHPIDITFRTKANQGCTRTISINGHDLALPETGQVSVHIPPQQEGTLHYTCATGMYAGFIRIH
ncbi:sulfite exporter TauE/SafE family protein [Acrocarpospora sp. B8E8]|uniref:sulfite exporter TauE/SafE family protein n=1 Tax=Acrocarpospora sp. B8E8 TaxID=3153572 RepID=UPI00325D5309